MKRTLHPTPRARRVARLAGLAAALTMALPAFAQFTDLAELSIEDLVNLEITSVGKKETPLFRSPAAVGIVTNDDVRRLGLSSIPEALRLVPGMNVARINAHTWAISARGFNLQYANKLLVLQDGRSVYTPSFGGVYWGAQDMMLEDLERIEVIRGPGATLWGANAVNGVINITSKNSRDTQGTLVSTVVGTEDRPAVAIRHGGRLGPDLHYRAYVKYFDRAGLVAPDGTETADTWDARRTGFRLDWEPTADDLVTFQGDYHSNHESETFDEPVLAPPFTRRTLVTSAVRGANVLARWTRRMSDDSQVSLQTYLDHFRNREELRDTADIQFENRFPVGWAHDVVWGIGYRTSGDEFPTSSYRLTPASRTLDLFTGFVQDEITLMPERVAVIVGAKFEQNDLTGVEVQPGLRILWTPGERQTFWGSAARAMSTPSRFGRDGRGDVGAFQAPGGPVVLTAVMGNPDLRSEVLEAYELGYRVEATTHLSFDFTAFHNRYDRLAFPVPGAAVFEFEPAPPHVLVPLVFQNGTVGESHGAEWSVQWQVTPDWRLVGSHAWLDVSLRPDAPLARSTPRHQVGLRSFLKVSRTLEFNAAGFVVGRVESPNTVGGVTAIPGYVRLDLGLVWRLDESFEFSLWGQNLLESRHLESISQRSSQLTEVPRSASARATWRF